MILECDSQEFTFTSGHLHLIEYSYECFYLTLPLSLAKSSHHLFEFGVLFPFLGDTGVIVLLHKSWVKVDQELIRSYTN